MNTPKPLHVMQFFSYDHLPLPLRAVSEPFGELAGDITRDLPNNPQRDICLQKLLEAKDAAVRCYLAKDPGAA